MPKRSQPNTFYFFVFHNLDWTSSATWLLFSTCPQQQLCQQLSEMLFFLNTSPHNLSQMKAVAGMKMSYNLQQAIEMSRKSIIRGFRQDETHSALCSHLFTMIRGNRQHRRAFLISLLNLFDDSSVSQPAVFSTCLGTAEHEVEFSY